MDRDKVSKNYFNMGKFFQTIGDYEKSISHLKAAVKILPNYYDAHFLLGFAYEMLGRYDNGLLHYKKSLKVNENDPTKINRIGEIYRKKKEFDKSEIAFKKAISLSPNFLESLISLAILYIDKDQLQKAVETYQSALALAPDSAELYNNLGNIQSRIGNTDQALFNYKKALKIKPKLFETHYNMGNILKSLSLFDDAILAYKKAIEIKPDFFQAINELGNVYRIQGKKKRALSAYKKAISINSKSVSSYQYITVLRKYNTKDDLILKMESLLTEENLNLSDKIILNFSLGKAYEDLEQYNKAFQYISEGNKLKRSTFNYDLKESDLLFKNIKNIFTPSLMKIKSSYGIGDKTPIFIIGMPRSGTSLVEQIISSHPNVHGGGELLKLDQILSTYAKKILKTPYPFIVEKLSEEDCKILGTAYIKEIRNLNRDKIFITDKMPQNFLFVGLIKLILPKAKIIHCTRDPADTCFSIFKHNFTKLHKYAYELGEIWHYFRLYLDLMRYWNSIIPKFIHEICYESIVLEPQKEVQKLLNVCELNWSDECLSFYNSNRPVLTASTAQVRRPLYTKSIELWRNYEIYLKDFWGDSKIESRG